MLRKQAETSLRRNHRFAFFHQSGWMIVATTVGGMLMYSVHMMARKMPKEEYGVFTTLCQAMMIMGIPAVGLQCVFAQQAAASMGNEHERELANLFRGVLRGVFLIWLIMVGVVFLFREWIISALKISNPTALWATVIVGLFALLRTIPQGVLQGRQNFLWLGGIIIIDGLGRLAAVYVVVGLMANHAAGAMIAVLIGAVLVTSMGVWLCRDCFCGETLPINWSAWLKRVVPLTLGVGVGVFMLTVDMLFVQLFFPKDETGYYAAAGMIGRAQVFLSFPISKVMFPKLARGSVTGEKTNALALAIGVTTLASVASVLVCTFFPDLPLQIVYDKTFLDGSTHLEPVLHFFRRNVCTL